MYFDDPRLDMIWETLRMLRPDLCRLVGGETYDELWSDLSNNMNSVEEDLARLKGLEK